MLHRLHASKVSEGCVSSFVPCTSPCPKPSLPHPFLIYKFTLKGGGKWGVEEKHISMLNKVHKVSSLLSFAATAHGVLHHRLFKQECVCMRGGGRRHSSIAQRVLNGQNVYVSPFVRTALAQPAVFIVHRNCSASSSGVFCLGLLRIKDFFLPLGTRDKAVNYSCLSVTCLHERRSDRVCPHLVLKQVHSGAFTPVKSQG